LTYLETHLGADGLEVGSSREEGNLNHAASSETSSKVGWASQDPAEVLGVHEVGAFGLEDLLDLLSTLSESRDDRFDVVALLHGDDSHLVLFVDPDEKVGIVVVEDSSGIGPVSATARGKKKSRVGLLKILNQKTGFEIKEEFLECNLFVFLTWKRFPACRSSSSFSMLMPFGLGAYDWEP
jgi:hypothetical protein